MKVVFLTHYSKLYGANRSMLNLIEGLIPYGVKPFVLTPQAGDLTLYLADKKIPFQIADFHTELYYMRGFSRIKGLQRHLLNKYAYSSIKKLIEQCQPDIIHTNTSGLHIGAKVAYALGLPHIWHIREFGELDYKQKFNLGRNNFLKWLNRSKHVVAISKAIKFYALSDTKAPVEVIHNGVMPQAQMSKKQFSGRSKYDFLIIGALQKEKGQELAIKAFHNICQSKPSSRMAIVGDSVHSAYTAHLKDLCQLLQIENNVTFTGYVKDPIPYYHQSKILLMCSQHEAMGRTTAEAMALGLPVIGYQGGATPELVEHGQTGLLFSNQQELEENMHQLVNQPLIQEAMGNAGYERAVQMFSTEQYCKAILRIYQKALS